MKRGKSPSLALNVLMNVILAMSTFIFPLITFPYVSRVLLAEGNGKVQMATSFVAYFTMIAQLGIPTYGIRACAAVRDNKLALTRTVHELTIIQLITTAVSYVLFLLCLMWIPKLQQERALYLISSLTVLLGSLGMEWLFKAMEQYTYITVRSIIFKIISVIAMFALVHTQEDYVIYGAITVFAAAGSNVMNLTQLHKYISLKPVGGYQIRRHIKPALVLFAYVCATTIYTNMDSVMLGFMTTDADVGYYSVAVKIKIILVSVVTALGSVLLPRVSYYYEQGLLDDFWAMAEKALRIVLLMALPLTAYFMIFAKQGIFFLSGDSYAQSVLPMVIIMPTLVCIGLTSVTGIQILIPMKRENVVLYASVAGAIADLILNAILIPPMQAAGAAVGTLAAEAIVLVWQVFVLREKLLPMFSRMRIGRIGIGVALSCGASFWIAKLQLSDFWTLATSAVVFLGVYAIVLHIGKDPFVMEMEARFLPNMTRMCKKRQKE